MRIVRLSIAIVVLLCVTTFVQIADQKFRTTAQQNRILYQIMIISDVVSFTTNGGGPLGYNNYFKYSYATWRKSPERTLWQKALFWDRGFFYDASDPPSEYRYPPHFSY